MSGQFDALYLESWEHFRTRVQRALADVRSVLEVDQTACVFTSGGPISTLSQVLLHGSATQLMQINAVLVNCGVTVLTELSQGLEVTHPKRTHRL